MSRSTIRLTVTLQDSSQAVIPKVSDLQPGVFCSALFSEDNSWYRARVLFLDSDTVSETIIMQLCILDSTCSSFVCVCECAVCAVCKIYGCVYAYLCMCNVCILWLPVQTGWVAFCWKSQQLQGSTTAHWWTSHRPTHGANQGDNTVSAIAVN